MYGQTRFPSLSGEEEWLEYTERGEQDAGHMETRSNKELRDLGTSTQKLQQVDIELMKDKGVVRCTACTCCGNSLARETYAICGLLLVCVAKSLHA